MIIEGRVRQILYEKEAYSIVTMILLDKEDEVTVKGSVYTLPGLLKLSGKWLNETTFYSYSCEYIIETKEDLQEYLISSEILPFNRVEELISKVGLKFLDVLDSPLKVKDPEELKKLKEWHQGNEIFLRKFLKKYSTSKTLFEKIDRDTVQNYMFKNNPYLLVERGFLGFETVDKVEKKPFNSLERIRAVIITALMENETQGSTVMLKNELLEKHTGDSFFSITLETMIKTGELVEFDQYIGRKEIVEKEREIADMLSKRICAKDLKEEVCSIIADGERHYNVLLSMEQNKSVKFILKNNLCILTGGPGTGKTSTVKVAIYAFKKLFPEKDILLLAPSGKAAQRLSESSGFDAKTIHKAVEAMGDGKYIKNENNPVEADFVIVDEASMCDVEITHALLRALKSTAKILFMGDTAQLPSVGAGNVLHDMLKGGVPSFNLTKVFRQKGLSLVATNAAILRNYDNHLEYDEENFKFIRTSSEKTTCVKAVEEYTSSFKKGDFKNVCLLSPFRKVTKVSVDHMNKLLQEKINPKSSLKKELVQNKKLFREGDLIIFNKNSNYVSNGDIAFIEEIDNKKVVFQLPEKKLVLPRWADDLNNLDLAYAMTIHKSQGSEYKKVIVVIPQQNVSSNLIYTAVTRSKKQVTIIGDENCLNTSIKEKYSERGTLLRVYLRENEY